MARKPVSYLASSVILGTAIGAVVGLLAAPKSGGDLRRTLRERALDARERMGKVSHDLPERLRALPKGGLERFTKLPKALRRNKAATGEVGTRVTVEGEHAVDPSEAP